MNLKNWKTSLGGLAILLLTAGKVSTDIVNGQPVDLNVTLTAILTGLGLLVAKDFNVSGTQK